MAENFNRQYRLTAAAEGQAFMVGEPNERGYAVHIKFDIERSDSETLNMAQICLWNLNDDELGVLMTTACEISLEAGYGDNLLTIFRGTVTSVNVELDSADRKVTIEAVDGFAELTSVYVSYATEYGPHAALTIEKDITDWIAEQIGIPVVYSERMEYDLGQRKLSNYSFVGTAAEMLDDFFGDIFISSYSDDPGCWYIEDGILYIRYMNEPVSDQIYVISTATGLIGIPGRIYNSAVSSDDSGTEADELYGYELVYLMNGAINVGDKVQVDSKTVQGTFLVYKLSISGDNYEGDWQCTADVTECE